MCKVKTRHLLAVNGLLPVESKVFHWAHHETVRYPYICK